MKRFALLLGLVFFVLGNVAFAQVEQKSIDQKIAELQKMIDQKGYHWTAGRTWVTELTDEQFSNLLGYKPPKGYQEWLNKQPKLIAKPYATFPAVFDWRDSNGVTSVKNQGNCGSCWDFAATGAFEAAIKIHDGVEYDLSEQQVMSCNLYEAGCEGGWAEPVYELFQRYGAVSEQCMPYRAMDGIPCTQSGCQVMAKLKAWQYVNNDVNSIKQALLTGPVYSTFSVYHDFDSYWSGCYQHTTGYYRGGHAIAIVGWDDNACGTSQGAWICKNSWGSNWGGLSGYFYIKWGDCGIGENTVLPIYPPDAVTLTYDSHHLYEVTGDGDGIPEIGEIIALSVDFKNSGPQTATSVNAFLSTTTPGINLINNNATFPDIPSDQIRSSNPPHFVFEISPSAENGTRADFNLDITCDQGSFNQTLYDFVGDFDTAFFDNMEGTDNGWTHGYFQLTDDWGHGAPQTGSKTDPTSAHSGSKIWGNNLSGDYQDNAYNYLNSPAINCSNLKKTRLWFYRYLAVEKSIYDHARILVNGNPVWENDPDYDHIDYKWTLHDIDISAYADSNPSVTVRFELQSDVGLHLGGWSIDDFTVAGVSRNVLGDVNKDKQLNIGDVVYLINYLYRGGPQPIPLSSGDVNCDGNVNIDDVVYLINYLFRAGQKPQCN